MQSYSCQLRKVHTILVDDRLGCWSWPFCEYFAHVRCLWSEKGLELFAIVKVRQFSQFLDKIVEISGSLLDNANIVFVECILCRNWWHKTSRPPRDHGCSHLIKLVEPSRNSKVPFSVRTFNNVNVIIRHKPTFPFTFGDWDLDILSILLFVFHISILPEFLMVDYLLGLSEVLDYRSLLRSTLLYFMLWLRVFFISVEFLLVAQNVLLGVFLPWFGGLFCVMGAFWLLVVVLIVLNLFVNKFLIMIHLALLGDRELMLLIRIFY